MAQFLAFLPILGPLALLAAAAFPGRRSVAGSWPGFATAALFCFAVAALTLVAVLWGGPLATGPIGLGGLGLSLFIDRLSGPIFLLVSFVGVVVVRFARTYLEGDPGHERFLRRLCATLGAILLFVVAGNLLQAWLALVATSVALSGLLTFYPERLAGQLAARKKFLVSRLGDVALGAAFLLLYQSFGTGEISAIARLAAEGAGAGGAVSAAALLVAVAALLKSAQFPLHGWLLEVMETPTPVSALLHAGIINAGGFLVLRFAPLIGLDATALDVLAVVGLITALVGSLAMLAQTSIKVSLAWSTVGQMGFMMLECGLGLFGAAFLHLIAHSLYKAHAFLSSGSVMQKSRGGYASMAGGVGMPRLLIGLALAAVLTLGVGALGHLVGLDGQRSAVVTVVVLLGLLPLVLAGLAGGGVAPALRLLGLAALAVGLSVGLNAAAEVLLAGALPESLAPPGLVVGIAVVGFAALASLQVVVRRGDPRFAGLYALAANGLYVNTIVNRLVLRFWPRALPKIPTARPATLLHKEA